MLQQTLVPLVLAFSSTISAAALPKPSHLEPRALALTLSLPDSDLPEPTGTLQYVALGLGTQNYTCASTPNSPSASPVSIGAVAKLSNAGPFLQSHPDLIDNLSGLVLGLSTMTKGDIDPARLMGLPYLGQHFFTAAPSSPEFDCSAVKARLLAKKLAGVVAPSDACQGPNSAGAVDWLQLGDNGLGLSFGGVSSVFRVETAGGKAPATCEGSDGGFTVPYAALYWFYG